MASIVTRLVGGLHSNPPPAAPGHVASSVGLGVFSTFGDFIGSANALWHAYGGSSARLLVLGSIIETGRRLFKWFITRFSIEYCTTIRLNSGDPTYEWVVLLLTQENVWRRSREFVVTANNSRRKWAVQAAKREAKGKANAEYVPTYQRPQLFRWRGYWVEIQRQGNLTAVETQGGPYAGQGSSMNVTIYTLDMNVLSDFIEDAYQRYVQVNRPHVVVHMVDTVSSHVYLFATTHGGSQNFGPNQLWTSVKHKMKRPLSSIILPDGVVDNLVGDCQEFLNSEGWYAEAGIPPSARLSASWPARNRQNSAASTIYALAGALNLEIYVLPLSSRFVDDAYLQRAASAIPKHGIFVIEDIDCAFPSRDDEDADLDDAAYAAFMHNTNPSRAMRGMARMAVPAAKTAVTLSGLLNVIDGVGSEEGKLFFATTNHIDRLDAALMRPGRIDVKVQYEMATNGQAEALFARFFPAKRFPELAGGEMFELEPETNASTTGPTTRSSPPPSYYRDLHAPSDTPDPELDAAPAQTPLTLARLAAIFASRIPESEFTTAELQGYLQGYKAAPITAARNAPAWVQRERDEREERARLREERRQKVRERRERMAEKANGGANANAGMGMGYAMPPMPVIMGANGGTMRIPGAEVPAMSMPVPALAPAAVPASTPASAAPEISAVAAPAVNGSHAKHPDGLPGGGAAARGDGANANGTVTETLPAAATCIDPPNAM
ncbi:hypothetical protein MKEN_01309600 [Mycena kentingensis (nom. inval.)]|nr:hypothetical protein MKEN_01309600 [Mycena kentingensis (nom. inval.)]